MQFFDIIKQQVRAITGTRQEFEQLLQSGDINAALERMESRETQAKQAISEYDTYDHPVMRRPDKIITDKRGNFIRKESVWKLPIPYPVYINEVALVFLYGRPVKWIQQSAGTDRAFDRYLKVIKDTRFDSKIRQCKRLAGAETESAMLFRAYRNDKGQADLQIRVLARSKGDEIYAKWDKYDNLQAVAWGYNIAETGGKTTKHVEIFTPDKIHRCTKRNIGWEVETEENIIGKIPVILFHQQKEWAGVEHLINREEHIASRTADTNDYFSDPIAIMNADIIKNMPEKKEAAKILVTNDKDGVDKAAKYLTWDSAPESKRQEIEWLQERILTMSFTPQIGIDTLKSVSSLSAKALKTIMMLAGIKASRHKETHDEMLSRTASLITTIIGRVLDVSLAAECESLQIGHEFQEPFGEDVADNLTNIINAHDAGLISDEGAMELNPLIKNAQTEMERIKAERETAAGVIPSVFTPDPERNGSAQ